MNLRLSLLLILAFLLPALAGAQSRKDLEEKRKRLIRDIQVTDKMLKKTVKSKESAYDRYVALQSQIENRADLIATLEAEIVQADHAIERNTLVVASLSADIERMKAEYGRIVRSMYRRKLTVNPLLFLLSAASLNEAFQRWLFLRKYDQYRKKQSEAIAFTRDMLSRRILDLENTRAEKAQLLDFMQGQKTVLTTEMADKQQLIQSLSQDESRLKQDLQKKQAAHEALNQAIERIIQEEVNKRVEEARNTKPVVAPKPEKPSAGKPLASPEPAEANVVLSEDKLSAAFRAKRGKLPWPVESGFIARAYGKQQHPTIKNIEITNNGIDIRTEEGALVSAVFDGKVAGVQFIPGHDYTVIIQHGDYYSVYSNLSETSLQKGQYIKAKQGIGRVSGNPITGASELHFELWKEKERMNPAPWIKK